MLTKHVRWEIQTGVCKLNAQYDLLMPDTYVPELDCLSPKPFSSSKEEEGNESHENILPNAMISKNNVVEKIMENVAGSKFIRAGKIF